MKCPKYCQIFRDREISGCLAGDETQWGVTANGYKGSLCGDENVLKLY